MTDAENGRGQDTPAHIAQSIRNILFTRIGTRLMREEYGSFIPDLIDMPAGPPPSPSSTKPPLPPSQDGNPA